MKSKIVLLLASFFLLVGCGTRSVPQNNEDIHESEIPDFGEIDGDEPIDDDPGDDDPIIPVLKSISLSGTYKTNFIVDDTFNHDGIVVTAHYSDSSSKVVTSSCNFSTPDMTSIGEKVITITYLTVSTSYNIVVSQANLGLKTIKEVREIIKNKTIEVNDHDIGVNYNYSVTIRGFAVDIFDLVKTKKEFGLNVSYPAKVIMADATGYIACASNNGNGATLYCKVNGYEGKDTSRYEVTGYISIYLGQPELCVPDNSFTFNSSLGVTKDYPSYVKEEITVQKYLEYAQGVRYNCAGHGYDAIYKINDLTCYSYHSSGQNSAYYYFTDGVRMVKVIKGQFTCSIGSVYSIIGILTTKNYSPAIRGLAVYSSSAPKSEIDATNLQTKSTTDLRKIYGDQDDTDARFDNLVTTFGTIYKVDAYVNAVTENGKYYFVFSDKYLGTNYTKGKDDAGVDGCIFIKNSNYWNVTADAASKYNHLYNAGYYQSETKATLYYIPDQLRYSSKKPIWEVFLLNECLPPIE